MRILIVTPEYPPDYAGGIGSYYAALVPALEAVGCEVTVLHGSAFRQAQDPPDIADSRRILLERSYLDKWIGQFSHLAMFPMLSRHLAAAFALHEQAQSHGTFDVVEATDWGFGFLPWVVDDRVRLLIQLHGSCGQISAKEPAVGHEAEGMVEALIEQTSFAMAPCVSSHGPTTADYWQRRLGRRVDYLAPPVQAMRNQAAQPSSESYWLTLGRIQEWKGPDVACAAWEALDSAVPSLHWHGRDTTDASGRSKSMALARSFPEVWGSRVLPRGTATRVEAAALIRNAKAVLVPSTWDVFNLAAAEAMLAGKPVVVSDGAGASELIDDGVNGFVFESGNAQALADTVRRVEAMPAAELRDIGVAARTTATEKLDPLRIARGKMLLYESVRLPTASLSAEWLREWLLSPTRGGALDFLESMPLRPLAEYVLRRSARKVGLR